MDKKGLLTFPWTASIPTHQMKIEDKMVSLTPGMAVTVEVKTGTRRVGEYFLSPLVQDVQESLTER
jgi:hemolysin D